MLTNVDARGNQLTSINLSQNQALEELDLSENQLTSIDLSNNPLLTNVYAYSNQLTSIDLSQNQALEELNLSENQLTSIDLSNNPSLHYLQLDENKLISIDLRNNLNLAYNARDNIFNENELDNMYIILGSNEYANILLPDHYWPEYSVDDNTIIQLDEDKKIKGINFGNTTYSIKYCDSEENEYTCHYWETFDVNLQVIKFTSDKYEINHDSKTIDCNKEKLKDIKASDFEVTLGAIEIENNKLKILIDDEEVFVYELTNLYQELGNSNVDINNFVSKKEEVIPTKKATTSKNSGKKVTTTTESKKEETTTTTEKVVVNKVVEDKKGKTENKEKSVPIVPIAVGGGAAAIAGLGYGIYLLKIKH